MLFDELNFCLCTCGSIKTQIPPATAVGKTWAVFLIPPHMLEVAWVQCVFHSLGKHSHWAQSCRHIEACTQLWDHNTIMPICATCESRYVCVYLLLLFLMLMPASVFGGWGFFMGSEHWPIIGTAVARCAFQPSRKSFMCKFRAPANPSQSCTNTHSYFWGCSITIGSHTNMGSARACAQCCQGRVGDRNEFIVHAMTRINVKIIMLSERSQ